MHSQTLLPPFLFCSCPAVISAAMCRGGKRVTVPRGRASSEAATLLRACFVQSSPQGEEGRDRLRMLRTNLVPGVCPPPPLLFEVSCVFEASGSREGMRAGKISQAPWLTAAPAAFPAMRESCFRAQHTNQMDPNSLPIPHSAPGWQICDGERSGLILSRLSIFLARAAIQHFCCQPGILK